MDPSGDHEVDLERLFPDGSEMAVRVRTLRASEERFRTLFHRSRDGIIILDGRGKILEWNKGEEAITGIPRSEAVGHPIWELRYRLLPDEIKNDEYLREFRENAIEGLKEGAELQRLLEQEIQRPDGTRRVLQSIVFSLPSNEGCLAGAISRDITEQKLLEENLRERQALLIEVERLAHLGHWSRDLRTGSSSWSDEVYRVLGLAPGSLPPGADTLAQSLAPEDRERIVEALNATARDGITRNAEFRSIGPQGAVRFLHGTVELLRDAHGAPARIFGTIQDISERKRMEDALAEAGRHKDDFLAVLSHELRNPLAPIRNSLYVLEHAELGGEQSRRMRAIIERQVSHLTGLVDDLLDLTRISRGKIHLRKERFELGDLVRRTMEDHRSIFSANGILLEGGTASKPLWTNADPRRIAQIIGNLLTNAAKFTPRGGRVEVDIEEDDHFAVLQVCDTGVGITCEMIDRLFEPFMQADRTLDRAGGGLGIGLALVKGLTELHGGSVTVASEGQGRGSLFAVRLPLEIAPDKAAGEEAKRERRPRRVLIIEDHRDAADSLREALELNGHEVLVTYDGQSGIAWARKFRPDFLICDIGLPGMDGYEVAQAFRSDDALRHVHLVALSGYALPEDLQRAQDAGFEQHVAKPPCLEEIEDILAHPGGLTLR
jgi:PAS domain S-box-containing protein